MQTCRAVAFAASLLAAAQPATAPAQQLPKPKAGDTLAFPVPMPGRVISARAHGRTLAFYLDQAAYPLVVVLHDRKVAANATLRALPTAVLDRRQMIVVVPELTGKEYEPAGFDVLQQQVLATIDMAQKVWSLDARRVVLLGVGQAAGPALALARAQPDRFAAVLALGPTDGFVPGATSKTEVPALVVTAPGKPRAIADQLQKEFGWTMKVAISERPDAANPAAYCQEALDWFAARLLPPPKDDKDRIQGRTGASRGGIKERILVIEGEYDTVQDVLKGLEIPHLAMTWQQFADFDLAATDVVLINCSGGQAWGAVRAKIDKRLRQFVTNGGHLFGTDWSLLWPVAEVFPDYIGDLNPGTPDLKVDAHPAVGAGNHELLQNVFPLDQPYPRWQIDAASFLVKDVDKKLDVLLASDELAANYEGNKMLGVTFRVGAYGGLVLNVVSHFSHQGDGTPTTPMYQLIVNFLNVAKRHREQQR